MTSNSDATVSAEPQALFHYANVAVDLDAGLFHDAALLQDRLTEFLNTCREVNVRIGLDAAAALQLYAARCLENDEWVRQVGKAILLADNGSMGDPLWIEVEAYTGAGAEEQKAEAGYLKEQGWSDADIARFLLATQDADQLLSQANDMDRQAQRLLDNAALIQNSKLGQTDKKQYTYKAALLNDQAKQLRLLAWQVKLQRTQIMLMHARQRLQFARTHKLSLSAIVALEDQVAALQYQLDGDPDAAARVRQLQAEQQRLRMELSMLRVQPWLALAYIGLSAIAPWAPEQISNYIASKEAELRQVEADLNRLDPQVGIADRLNWAKSDADASRRLLEQALAEWQNADKDYQQQAQSYIPRDRKAIHAAQVDLDRVLADPALSPQARADALRLRQYLNELEALLDTQNPQQLADEVGKIQHFIDATGRHGNRLLQHVWNSGQTESLHTILADDPRLGLLAERQAFANDKANPAGRMFEDLLLNTWLFGAPALLEHWTVNSQPGISPELRGANDVNLVIDAINILLNLADPAGKLIGFFRIEGRALALTDDAILTLKAEGYTDDMIAKLNTQMLKDELVPGSFLQEAFADEWLAQFEARFRGKMKYRTYKQLRTAGFSDEEITELSRLATNEKMLQELGKRCYIFREYGFPEEKIAQLVMELGPQEFDRLSKEFILNTRDKFHWEWLKWDKNMKDHIYYSFVKNIWPSGDFIEAMGVEAAVQYLEMEGYKLCYVGRRGRIVAKINGKDTQLSLGPDIIAIAPDGQITIVEVKGSISHDARLDADRLTETVRGIKAFQPSRKWLITNPKRYLKIMSKSTDPDIQRAYRLMMEVLYDNRKYRAIVIAVGDPMRWDPDLVRMLWGLDNGTESVLMVLISMSLRLYD